MATELTMDIRKQYGKTFDPVKIRNAAEDFRAKAGIDDKEFQFRFPVVTVLGGMGFQLMRGTFRDPTVSGLLAVDSSLPEKNPIYKTDRAVFVNRKDSVQHQRFTIAHELAHYIFDYDESNKATYYRYYKTSEANNDEEEIRANRFAAELLMPYTQFRQKYEEYVAEQKGSFSLPSTISHLSKLFDVPAKAVQFRLVETKCKNPITKEFFTND